MKKHLKFIPALFLGLVVMVTLSGCSVYHDYSSALPYNNVYEKINLKKLVSKLEEEASNTVKNEVTYVMYTSADVVASSSAMKTIDEQAKQYKIETVYYLDATKIYQDADNRKDLQDKLGIRDASSCPSILMFIDGELEVDWTRTSTKNKYDGSFTRVAYDIFYTKVADLNSSTD